MGRKRKDYQVIDTRFAQKLNFFIEGSEQAQVMLLFRNHQPWVRIESKNHTFATCFCSQAVQLSNYFTVPLVNPIERTDGNNRVNGFKMVYVLVNYQYNTFLWSKSKEIV